VNEIALRFGENLVRLRKRTGYSQEETSIRASLHRTEVSYLERGLRFPRIDTLAKLMGALDVSADEMLEGIVWVPEEFGRGAFSIAPRVAFIATREDVKEGGGLGDEGAFRRPNDA
jgi:transcriptional regulator with XRE-family HTH domain